MITTSTCLRLPGLAETTSPYLLMPLQHKNILEIATSKISKMRTSTASAATMMAATTKIATMAASKATTATMTSVPSSTVRFQLRRHGPTTSATSTTTTGLRYDVDRIRHINSCSIKNPESLRKALYRSSSSSSTATTTSWSANYHKIRGRRLFSTQGNDNTYYDSQSGLHLPVHNEREIQLFLDTSNTADSSLGTPFVVPCHLYKDPDAASTAGDVQEQIQALQKRGVHGVVLPTIEFPRDIRNLRTLSSIMEGMLEHTACGDVDIDSHHHRAELFQFYTSYSGDSLWQEFVKNTFNNTTQQTSKSRHNSPLGGLLIGWDFSDDIISVERLLSRSIDDNVPTSLYIPINEKTTTPVDPISLSNSVATLLDRYPGSCHTIWIDTTTTTTTLSDECTSSNADALSVIEELIYLDVAGPTIKSRLVVQACGQDDAEELIEDVMFAGVNKFVVRNVEQDVEIIEEVANDQGKKIVKSIASSS